VPVADTLGKDTKAFEDGYDLQLITHRDVRMTKSRTITHPYLTDSLPENAIFVSAKDAQRLKLRNGQKVKVTSATNAAGVWELGNGVKKPMIGTVAVIEGIRPGIVSFTVGHGMWGNGATDVVVDGMLYKASEKRQGGVHANAAMWIDPHLKNTCMIDKVGGSVSFYDTKVKLVPA
jgi:anaerobic selenocysteine-containing dehydrogenase